MSWIERIVEEIAEHGALVRVLVIRADGSTPRESGAAMKVGPDHTSDTIGGGALELQAIARARSLLAKLGAVTAPWQREARDFALGPSLGQCCGGYTRLLFEVYTARERPALEALVRQAVPDRALLVRPVASGVPLAVVSSRKAPSDRPLAVTRTVRDMLSGARPRAPMLVRSGKGESDWFVEPFARRTLPLTLYGAGHVGRALVRVLHDLPFAVTWVDTSASRFPDAVPTGVRAEVSADPAAFAAAAPGGAAHVVMTYSHALDLAICLSLLRRGDFRYLGLIGSRTKRARFARRLGELGIGEAQLNRLVCPIGIPGLEGKEPGTIAVAVAAQLLQLASARKERLGSPAPLAQDGSP